MRRVAHTACASRLYDASSSSSSAAAAAAAEEGKKTKITRNPAAVPTTPVRAQARVFSRPRNGYVSLFVFYSRMYLTRLGEGGGDGFFPGYRTSSASS